MTRVIEYVGMRVAPTPSPLDRIIEDVAVRGFSVVEGVLNQHECAEWAKRLDHLNQKQTEAFGQARLLELNEAGTVRGMLFDDPDFLALVRHPGIWPVVEAIVGSTAILHLQNGIVVERASEHHQAAFHRDFAKDFVADRVLSLNALFAIDEFSEKTGGTQVVPYTHRRSSFPTLEYLESNAIPVETGAGSVIFFDSLLIHRAGHNRSSSHRRAVNQQYTRPFIKQQMDYPTLLRDRVAPESPLAQTLGFWSVPPRSVEEFRVDPEARTYRRWQG